MKEYNGNNKKDKEVGQFNNNYFGKDPAILRDSSRIYFFLAVFEKLNKILGSDPVQGSQAVKKESMPLLVAVYVR